MNNKKKPIDPPKKTHEIPVILLFSFMGIILLAYMIIDSYRGYGVSIMLEMAAFFFAPILFFGIFLCYIIVLGWIFSCIKKWFLGVIRFFKRQK